MPYCPQCRDEYVAGIARCPDCEVDLVADLSAASATPTSAAEAEPGIPDATPGVAVAHRPDLAGAESLAALLLGHAVPARVGESEADVGQPHAGWPIEVPPEFTALATRILRTAPDEESGDPEEIARDLALLELSRAALVREGEPAVAGLVRLLVRGRGEVVTRAAVRLARIEGSGVAALGEALVEAVAGDAAPIARAAVKALRHEARRRDLPPGLSDLVSNERPEVRVRALRVLAGLGGKSSVPLAVALLRDEVEEVREEAADALWELSQGRIDLDLDRDPEAVAEDIRILEEHHGR